MDLKVHENEKQCLLLYATEFWGGLLHSILGAIANQYTVPGQKVTPGCKGPVKGRGEKLNEEG